MVTKFFLYSVSSVYIPFYPASPNVGFRGERTNVTDCFEHCRCVPDMSEKAELARAGLEKKSISLFYYAEADELYSEIQMHYPQLGNVVGMRCLQLVIVGGKRLLEVMCNIC